MGRRKPSHIAGQFIAHRVEMLESPAWAALSFAARRILDRLEIEHAHHGGKDNGNLPCTYDDFERFGVRRKSIAPAIRQLVECGFVEITRKGSGGNAEFRQPSRYRLTYLPTKTAAPTECWRRHQKNRSPGAKAPPVSGAKTPLHPQGRNCPYFLYFGWVHPILRSKLMSTIMPVIDTKDTLPAMLNRAAQALEYARDSAEVLEARDMARRCTAAPPRSLLPASVGTAHTRARIEGRGGREGEREGQGRHAARAGSNSGYGRALLAPARLSL